MTVSWFLTIDCADAPAQARFWAGALGYVAKPPPTGFASWAAWFDHFDVPEDERDGLSALVDPDGVLPAISFLAVPEGKVVKNRLHLDLQVSGGRHVDQDVRQALMRETVDRLVAAGAKVVAQHGTDHWVLSDPEGNEFCVV